MSKSKEEIITLTQTELETEQAAKILGGFEHLTDEEFRSLIGDELFNSKAIPLKKVG